MRGRYDYSDNYDIIIFNHNEESYSQRNKFEVSVNFYDYSLQGYNDPHQLAVCSL